ncbi:MAG: LamG-like jellyroll fold domain-containing protein [Candidatus Paceibacterota bacterium]
MRKINAFTLIELLVVIAIIGILSALIIVGMSSTTQKATIAKAQVFSNSLRNSLMDDLVSEWKFDDASSGSSIAAVDSWSGNNSGTLTNFNFDTTDGWRTGTNCISNNCLAFDGGNDYVNIGDPASGNLDFGVGDFSVEAWVYYTGSTAINNIYGFLTKSAGDSSPGYWMGFTTYSGNGANLKLLSSITNGTWGSGNIENGSFFSPSTWQYIVLTRYGTTLKHYRNGVSDGQGTKAGVGANVDNAVSQNIGRYGSAYFTGLIDIVREYSGTIPTSQIQQNYFAGINKLFAKSIITASEYNQRISDLSNNYAKQ